MLPFKNYKGPPNENVTDKHRGLMAASDKAKLNGIATGADVTSTAINAAAAKTTPVDADTFPLSDSAASFAMKKVSWSNIKATLKTYLDTLYAALVHTHAASDLTSGIIAAARLPDRGDAVPSANVALTNAGYTTIMTANAVNAGTYTVVASVTMQNTGATAQTTRLRIRVNGVDVAGGYSWMVASGFIQQTVVWRGSVGAGQSIAVTGLVGVGSINALRDMPDGAGIRASWMTWF